LRFFVESSSIARNVVTLSEEDSAHISKVLRMREGEEITVCDEQAEHRCRILNIEKGQPVRAEILSSGPHTTEPSVFVTVYAALSKGDRFDYLVQKCTEVGVSHIVPFVSKRCVVRLENAKDSEKKRLRYERIALEASKQCLRSRPVSVGEILPFEQAMQQAAADECCLFLYEGEKNRSFKQILESFGGFKRISIITGPEGGFEAAEAALADQLGAHSVLIGPRILRCETAPLCALSAVMYASGEF
jgi:16S rRNA (uracil1498-N3)-methyltransferase